MLFKLTSVVYWRVATAVEQCQVDIENVREKAKRVTYDYTIGDRVYVEMSGIYRKLDYKKQGPYRITEDFTNSIVRFQRGKANERINIWQLRHHSDE